MTGLFLCLSSVQDTLQSHIYVCYDGTSDQQLSPIMENKNYGVNPGLNTINIAYSMRTHDALASLHRKNETTLQYSQPRPANLSPRNTSPPSQEPLDSAFNDCKLKYGKSQTLKEAVFNRMRIHIYRRDKRPKWLDLPQYEESPTAGKETPGESEKQIAKHRENKTSLNSPKQPIAHLPAKLNTSSSEEAGVEVSWKRKGDSSREGEMVDRERMNSIVRSLLGNAKTDNQAYCRYVVETANEEFKLLHRKRKKFSNSVNPFAKNAFGLKKMFQPPRLMPQLKLITAEQHTIDREVFEAWENLELSGSQRNGIVEYTKQYVKPEGREGSEKRENSIFSSKKQRRFLIRDKK